MKTVSSGAFVIVLITLCQSILTAAYCEDYFIGPSARATIACQTDCYNSDGWAPVCYKVSDEDPTPRFAINECAMTCIESGIDFGPDPPVVYYEIKSGYPGECKADFEAVLDGNCAWYGYDKRGGTPDEPVPSACQECPYDPPAEKIPSPSPKPSPSPSPKPTPSPSPKPASPKPSPSPSPQPAPIASPSPSPKPSPQPIASPKPSPSPSPKVLLLTSSTLSPDLPVPTPNKPVPTAPIVNKPVNKPVLNKALPIPPNKISPLPVQNLLSAQLVASPVIQTSPSPAPRIVAPIVTALAQRTNITAPAPAVSKIPLAAPMPATKAPVPAPFRAPTPAPNNNVDPDNVALPWLVQPPAQQPAKSAATARHFVFSIIVTFMTLYFV